MEIRLQRSWVDYGCTKISHEKPTNLGAIVNSSSDTSFNINEEINVLCINSVLPDDILERILALLPIATIIKAGCVCKKWKVMVHTGRYIQNHWSVLSQKPWYFMFTYDNNPCGHAYDPVSSKWYRFEIPYVEARWNIVSSSGLVCFMDHDYRRKLFVCNPLNGHCQKLKEPPGAEYADYCALALSLNKLSHSYHVTVVETKQIPCEQVDFLMSINIYNSENKKWVTLACFTSKSWRGGSDSVICDGVLYFVSHLIPVAGHLVSRYGVVAYDLDTQCSKLDINQHVILGPCPLTCMRLVNLEEELVMVGGIQKPGRPGIIKGIGIWILRDKEWEEVSRMPSKFIKGFGEFDEVFASSGFDKLIYVQNYGSPALLMFDMSSKEWKWAHKCPAVKKFPLQLFSGICFKPSLDIVP